MNMAHFLLSSFIGVDGSGMAIDLTMKITIVFAIAILAALLLAKASAAIRHRVWCLAFCVALILPVLSCFVPPWRLAILPASIHSSELTATVEQYNVNASTRLPAGSANGVNKSPILPEGSETHVLGMERSSEVVARVLVAVWSLGAVLSLLPILGGGLHTFLLRHDARPIEDPASTQLADSIRSTLGLRRHVRLMRIDRSIIPITWGVIRPTVLLPSNCGRWSQSRKRLVLLHEMAHIQRFDLPLQLIARVACGFYWFHPLAWYALHRLRIEREQACDDCVVAAGERASTYASELVRIAEMHCAPRFLIGIAMAQTSRLEGRLVALFDHSRSHAPLSRWLSQALFGSALVITFVIGGIQPVSRAMQAPPVSGDDNADSFTEESQDDIEAEAISKETFEDEVPSAETRAEDALKSFLWQGKVTRKNGKVVAARINHVDFGDDDVVHLSKLNWARQYSSENQFYPVLTLHNTKVTNAGVERIIGITRFENLAFTGNPNINNETLELLQDLSHLKELHLGGTSITDIGLVHLEKLTALERLFINDTQITDAGLKQLRGLTRLNFLRLSGAQVTDAGLKHLQELPNLEWLFLKDTKISDDGLVHLKSVPQLFKLRLCGTEITDAGLVHLMNQKELFGLLLSSTRVTDHGLTHIKGLSELRELYLDKTEVTSAGLAHISRLSELRWLRLGDTNISDDGLTHLKGLRHLKSLWLAGTDVTDSGITHLETLTNLEQLGLKGTKVTKEGVKRLQRLLPNCRIEYQ